MNDDSFYLLQNNTNKDYNANIYKKRIMHIFFKITVSKIFNANIYVYKQFYIYFKIILNKRFLVSNTQGLYCQELVFYK